MWAVCMKILVCGGRDFNNRDLLNDTINWCTAGLSWTNNAGLEIISGGANGADKIAADYATRFDITTCGNTGEGIKNTIVLPDWDKHKKAAGFIRNQIMIDLSPDLVIAFWDGKSKGTHDTINKAKKKGITTLVVYY